MAESRKNLSLRPLTPHFDESKHKTYAEVITNALNTRTIKNIALSGPYGVGKSSILSFLKNSKKSQAIFISLSTLGNHDQDSFNNSENQRIQKEIVKQLIYSESPAKLPDSRFRRIGKTRKLEVITIASILGLIASWGTFSKINEIASLPLWASIALSVIAFALSSFGLFSLIHWGKSRIQIKELSTGPAKIAISSDQLSYFDQYLDEIVYFFERTKKTIVVFEDIDRFENIRIFEELLALNTLLNNVPTLTKKNGIRFIYAVKDQIFGETSSPNLKITQKQDSVRQELQRANRTKFFDLIIPVVPFVTHESSRDLFIKELSEDDAESLRKLINIAARHIPDARLIRNICNEYVIYKTVLFSNPNNSLKLNSELLFAMMIYKSLHLDDYEKIRLGTSSLDAFFQSFNDKKQKISSLLSQIISEQNQSIQHIQNIQKRLEEYSDHLETALKGYFSYNTPDVEILSLAIADKKWKKSNFPQKAFWEELLDPSVHSVNVEYKNSGDVFYSEGSITKTDIQSNIDFDLTDARILSTDTKQEEKLLNQAKDALEKLRNLECSEAYVDFPGTALLTEDIKSSLSNLLDANLTSSLAKELVRNGFITRDFTLYTSVFHETIMTANAANFLLHHLRPGKNDFHYKLSDDEIMQVISESDPSFWDSPGGLNCDVIAYILNKSEKQLDESSEQVRILNQIEKCLIAHPDLAARLSEAFLASLYSNEAKINFIRWITSKDTEILIQSLRYSENQEQRLNALDTALCSMVENIKYSSNAEVKNALEQDLFNFKSTTDSAIETNIDSVFNYLRQLEVPLEDLSNLRSELNDLALNTGYFALNTKNLDFIHQKFKYLSLDRLLNFSEKIVYSILNDVELYIRFLNEQSLPAIETASEETLSAINEFAEDAVNILDELLLSSVASKWSFDSLSDIDESFWPVLARHNRILINEQNLIDYLQSIDFDSELSNLLERTQRIKKSADIEESEREQLAIELLSPNANLELDTQIRLLTSLELQNYIELDQIKPASGEQVARLISAEIIEDDVEIIDFTRCLGAKEVILAISASNEFSNYLHPGLLNSEEMNELFTSQNPQNDARDKIVSDLTDYINAELTPDTVTKIAQYAIENSHHIISEHDIEHLAEHGASTESILELIKICLLPVVEIQKVESILTSLGGHYLRLTQPGYHRPQIPNKTGAKELLSYLKERGKVSNFKLKDDIYHVSMRRR